MTKTTSHPRLVFDFHQAHRPNRLLFENPMDVIEAHHTKDVRPALERIQAYVSQGCYAAGFVSYEAAPAFDSAMKVHDKHDTPLLWFGIFDKPLETNTDTAKGDCEVGVFQPCTGPEEYGRNVHHIQDAIARGETYQVNYTMRLKAPFTGDAFAFYERLREVQRGQYCAYIDTMHQQILSVSPELFFQTVNGHIIAKPMKGTMPRGCWLEEDIKLRERLAHSEKDHAENVMIVDLLRNDLGRIAKSGSVRVDNLFHIDTYPTVFQMTSTVSAELLPDVDVLAIFSALFPCGSITGAPKVSTMNIIENLEPEPRNIYCGTIGYIDPNGNAIFNVAIRTVFIGDHQATYGTGGGITWDSVSYAEYDEALIKSRVLTTREPDFQLLETMKFAHGEIVLVQRHLRRLFESAEYFGIPVDPNDVQQALMHCTSELTLDEAYRIRLLVSKDGHVDIEHRPLPITSSDAVPESVALAPLPIDKFNRFLYHKTTYRVMYETQKAQRPDVFDVLLWNRDKELTEFTIGNLVLEIDGEKWTPARECGLLAGTYREELLEKGIIQERILTVSDLKRASHMWMINSVRGFVEVQLID